MTESKKSPVVKVVKDNPDKPVKISNEDRIDALIDAIENLSETDQEASRIYLASRLTKYGFAVIKLKEVMEEENQRRFSKMRLWSGNPGSKRPTLSELRNKIEADKQKFRDYPADTGDATAEEFVEEILHRAGVPASEQRNDLKHYFTRALKIFVPSPEMWQNPLRHINPDDVA